MFESLEDWGKMTAEEQADWDRGMSYRENELTGIAGCDNPRPKVLPWMTDEQVALLESIFEDAKSTASQQEDNATYKKVVELHKKFVVQRILPDRKKASPKKKAPKKATPKKVTKKNV